MREKRNGGIKASKRFAFDCHISRNPRLTGNSGIYYFYLRDHLGNHRIVMDASGNVVQVNNYYPSGATMADYPRRTDQSIQPYKFGGKELDRSNGLDFYDFEARSFDPSLMRFTMMDPLAEKYYGISPYVYCNNNPINRIDPNGMDDYSVNLKGQIELVKKTEDERDKLIALGKNDKIEYDDDGNMTNVSFDVDKGILDNQKKSGKTTYMSVKGNEQAEEMFKFLSENTDVEWGRLSYSKSSNYLSTNNDAYDNGIETVAYDKFFKAGKGNLIKSIDHSHPNAALPSGFGAVNGFLPKGQGDKAFAEWLYKYFPTVAPSIKLRVYNSVQKTYIQYNNKRILTK
jgi:RHS repeat-associated protein